MKFSRPGYVLFATFLTLGLLMFPTENVGAESLRDCIKKNRQFSGSTGACAEQICNWEACKARATGRKGRSGITFTDRGADPIAPCMPHQQVMEQCQRNPPRWTPAKREETKCPPGKYFSNGKCYTRQQASKPWCRNGKDSDRPRIRAKARELSAALKASGETLKSLRAVYRPRLAVWKPKWQAVLDTAAEFKLDKSRLTKEQRRAKWETSGRRAVWKRKVPALQAERKALKALLDQIKAVKAERKPMRKIGIAYNKTYLKARDCAAALSILGIQ